MSTVSEAMAASPKKGGAQRRPRLNADEYQGLGSLFQFGTSHPRTSASEEALTAGRNGVSAAKDGSPQM
jgi:hypothetical protein